MQNSFFENANCLNCNSNKNTIIYRFEEQESHFNIVKCECSFIYLTPRPTSLNIHKYYTENYLPHKKNKSFNFFQKITFYWKRKMISKHISKNSTILDVGSGNCSFGNYMKMHGFSVDSYDKYNSSALSKLPKNKIYDIVTCWHSIEHFHDINNIFDSLMKITNNKTRFFIALPNFDSIDSRLFNSNWIALDVPRHLFHFTSKTLSKYLKKYNISIVNKHRMFQDTFFNIYLSLRFNVLFKIIFMPIISLVSIIFICFNLKFSSSLLYICKRNS